MPKINVLPKHIADLIAAGEVVERPASVIKELMENAIDAGATSVTVEIKHGGITYMRVTDNGCGIQREDIRNAFKSHATSKISNEVDLRAIGTLGFRGEALASIAAVSKVDILTRTPDSDIGTVYKIEGSEEVLLDDAGCPAGTTIVVKDLFYNTPARMKFLKKDVTEGNSVAGVVDRIALSHPEVSVRFVRDDRQQLVTSGNGKLSSTVYSVFGSDFASGLLETDYELNGIHVSGLVSKPSASRSNRSMQFFFLNGRLVKSRTASAALEQAYKNAIMIGRFPSCVLEITMPLEAVDVNVHPAKTEVRFENEKIIFDAVYYAAKNVIEAKDTPNRVDLSRLAAKQEKQFRDAGGEQMKLDKTKKDVGLPEKVEGFWTQKAAVNYREEMRKAGSSKKKTTSQKGEAVTSTPISTPASAATPASVSAPTSTAKADQMSAAPRGPVPYVPKDKRKENSDLVKKPVTESGKAPSKAPLQERSKEPDPVPYAQQTEIPDFRILGEAFKTYILVEVENMILLVDKHAAHERILFDQLKANLEEVKSQLLLTPVTVNLSKEEYAVVMDHLDTLKQAGFDVDDFGVGTVVVREVPVMMIQEDPAALIEELAGYLMNNKSPIPDKLNWMYANIACRAAIKAGDNTPPLEQKKLVEFILGHREIRYCPHGRPITIEMTRTELEKQFGRIQWHIG